MRERLYFPVDAYMLLERGGRLLTLRRAAGAPYAPLLRGAAQLAQIAEYECLLNR